jgi:hypothetical protein
MKKVLFFLFLAALAAGAYGQQRITVMVPPFKLVEGVSQTERDTITRLFLGRLSATGVVTVVNAANLQQRMDYLKWELSDWSNNEKKGQLNAGFNADYLIIGAISRLFGELWIDITAEDLNTFAVTGSADVTLQGGLSPDVKINELVRGIVQTMTGKTGPISGGTDTYKVGDRGPGGGIIFFDKGVFADGWRYLEAAPNDIGPAQWGAYVQSVSGTSAETGKGKANTQAIISRLRQLGETGKAAQLCEALNINGCNDWFLPSRGELNLMYVNLKQKGMGGFQDEYYWSSTQDGITYAWVQSFTSGNQPNHGKSNASSVRAVRAF